MKVQKQGHDEMQGLAEKLAGQRVAMVTMREGAGQLACRPLTPLEMDAAGDLWFMVSRKSFGILSTPAPQPINVAFSDEGKSLYVSIAGLARLVDDSARKQALWSTMARPFFSGADDPDLTLLQVNPQDVEIWDGPDSSTVRALAMAASVVAGRPIGLGSKASVQARTATGQTYRV